jgi:4-hydroxyproline epimerase
VAGVIFFNNVGTIHMCGHGMFVLAVTLAHLGKIQVGQYKVETAVGVVPFEYHGRNRVTITNVSSYRARKDVAVDVPGVGLVRGDVAWGGNWFFLVEEHGQELSPARTDQLIDVTWRIRKALGRDGITGADGGEIDHIELFGPPSSPDADSRNFVLCPGKAYDRSPCGTGTSAKLACLVADGKLRPGEVWRQESIVGTVFEGSVRLDGDRVIPRITGTAYVTGEATLILDERDPFCWGIA